MCDKRPVVFLDIDGVLNNVPETVGCPVIRPENAAVLTGLLLATRAGVVLISSWRKWINDGLMLLEGMSLVLRTHGIPAEVVGALPQRALSPSERGPAIAEYAKQHGIERYVVIDDRPLDVPNLVQTDGTVGMTTKDALTAYRILRDGT